MMKAIKLDRRRCSILSLVLKRKWYDMIANGEKLEEYRDVKDYYRTRIRNFIRRIAESKEDKLVVAFSCGRKKADLFMTVIGVNTYPDCLHPEWGEPKGNHYVISLGGRVELTDCESEASKWL